jgi:uncharacterized membrane protein YqjE
MMTDERPGSTIPNLFSDVLSQVTNLFRTEIRLAKTEMSEKISTTMAAGGVIMAGGVLLLAALFLFLQGIVLVLVMLGIPSPWATFIVAVVTGLVGYHILRKGMSNLTASNMMPDRTVRSLEKDATVAKEQVR